MGLLGSVILSQIQHVASGTAWGEAHTLFFGSTVALGVMNWNAQGLFCNIRSENSVATGNYRLGLNLTVGQGFTNASGTAGTVSVSVGFGTVADVPAGGDWAITCDCERLIGWYDDSLYQTIPGFATDGGVATPDSPRRVREVIWDRPRAGGTLGVTANLGGTISLSKSILITAADALSKTIAFGQTMTAGQENASYAGTAAISGAFDGTALHAPPYNATIGGVQITAADRGFVSVPAGKHGTVQMNANLPRAFRAEISLRSGLSPYSGNLTLNYTGLAGTVPITVTDGAHTFGETQRSGNVQANHFATFGTASWDEYRPLRMWCDNASLVARGEHTRDWRMKMLSLPPWAALSVEQAGTVLLCGGDTKIGSSPVVEIALPDASTPDALKGTAWSGASLLGFRYAVVYAALNLSSVASGTVSIGSKQWSKDYQGNALTFGTAQTARTIDLLCPTNATATTDTTDSKYPYTPSVPWTANSGSLSGVANATALLLRGGASGTVALGSVTLVRLDHTHLHILPAFDNFVSAGDSSQYRVDSLWAETDYRKSLETIDFFETAGLYYERTIGEVAASINGNGKVWPTDGWSGSAHGSADNYRGSAIRACFLGGGGATYNSGWTYWQNQSAAGSLGILAQLTVDEITSWVPGDDTHGYGVAGAGTLSVAAYKIFRAGAWGAVHGTTSVALSGSAVTLLDVTESDSGGGGTTNAFGGYYTGAPYVQGGHSGRVSAGGENVVLAMAPRKLYRVGFRLPVETEGAVTGICYDVSGAGRHAIAYAADGTAVLGLNTDAFGLTYGSASTGILGTPTCLRWERSQASRLYLLYGAGGSVFVQVTQNEGSAWSMAGTIATTGTAARAVFCRDGRKYYFWLNGGTIYTRAFDSVDAALGTAYPVVSGGVDNDAIDAQEWYGNKGQWRINLHYRSGGNLITVTTSDGVSFS